MMIEVPNGTCSNVHFYSEYNAVPPRGRVAIHADRLLNGDFEICGQPATKEQAIAFAHWILNGQD